MMAQAGKKGNGKGLWKMMQIAGLAMAIPFEIAAGPFIGYFIGVYLKNRFGIHRYVVYLLILMGFIASIVNTVTIIQMMVRIDRQKKSNKE